NWPEPWTRLFGQKFRATSTTSNVRSCPTRRPTQSAPFAGGSERGGFAPATTLPFQKQKEPMQRAFTSRVLWLVFALLFVVYFLSAAAQLRIVPDQVAEDHGTQDVAGYLRRAAQLEGELRWGEALTVYEEALREFPEDASLGSRHNLAKIHYDLGRRYSD